MSLNITGEENIKKHSAIYKLLNKLESEKRHTPNYNHSIHSIYTFSNENLDEIFKDRDLTNKRVLTVGSSGDQVIEAILHGSNDITLIDANPMSQPYIEYKLSAIKNLTFSEFLDCFSAVNYTLNHKYYSKISHDLSDYSKYFWDNIFLNLDSGCFVDLIRGLYHPGGIEDKNAFSYCNDMTTFYKLKEKINDAKIIFKVANLNKFREHVDGKYDLILLSNILDYVGEKDFIDDAKYIRDNHLSSDGEIQLYYDFLGYVRDTSHLKEDFLNAFDKNDIKIKKVKDVRYSVFYSEHPDLDVQDCSVIFI